jgi:hypothetical protein
MSELHCFEQRQPALYPDLEELRALAEVALQRLRKTEIEREGLGFVNMVYVEHVKALRYPARNASRQVK